MPEQEKTADMSKKITELPLMTEEFEIDVRGDVTNKRFIGAFACKIMNQKERALVAKHKAHLNGPNPDGLDVFTLLLHHKIAYLRYTVIAPYPKFWETSDLGYTLFDGNVIDVVYAEVLDWEDQWMRKVWGDEAVDAMREAKK